MSKVIITKIGQRTYSAEPLVMTWDQYVVFAKKTHGEGVTWRASLA